jgi:hypothetical protein
MLISCCCRKSSPASSTNVAAIAGGVVGGVVLALILSAAMFIVIRRRFRQARLTFVGEDGLEGGGSIQPPHSEEDMPPPTYGRIFPPDSSRATGDQVRGFWRIGLKPSRRRATVPSQAAPHTSAAPAIGAPPKEARPQEPVDRAILDASIWTWKGEAPPDQRLATLEKHSSLPVGDVLEK